MHIYCEDSPRSTGIYCDVSFQMRTGESQLLDYAKGGILCSANSYQNVIVAGYVMYFVVYYDTYINDMTMTVTYCSFFSNYMYTFKLSYYTMLV